MTEKRRKQDPIIKTYKPIMDWWVALIVFIVLAMLVMMIFSFAISPADVFIKILIIFIILWMILYTVDVAFFTVYFLEEDSLVIENQLKKSIFPYRNIEKMEKSGFMGLFSHGSKRRFSLSKKGVYVYLNKSHWKRVSLSPVDREDFMESLTKNIEIERSSRATIVRKR